MFCCRWFLVQVCGARRTCSQGYFVPQHTVNLVNASCALQISKPLTAVGRSGLRSSPWITSFRFPLYCWFFWWGGSGSIWFLRGARMKSPAVIESASVPFSGSVFASWPCSSVLDAHVWWYVLHWHRFPLVACSVYLGVWWQQNRSCCPGLVYMVHLFSYLFTFHFFISL